MWVNVAYENLAFVCALTMLKTWLIKLIEIRQQNVNNKLKLWQSTEA